MINLTDNVQQPPIVAWRLLSPPDGNNRVVVRFFAVSGSPSIDFPCILSDTASACMGVKVNPSPTKWNDKLVRVLNVGAANSLTNAIAAYRGAASHNAGLKAMEVQALTDGWIDAALTGT
jgi:hypothetical protein